MISALDSGSSGPGSSPILGHCDVFLAKTLFFYPPKIIIENPENFGGNLTECWDLACTGLFFHLGAVNNSHFMLHKLSAENNDPVELKMLYLLP